jgi:hypothetical protein
MPLAVELRLPVAGCPFGAKTGRRRRNLKQGEDDLTMHTSCVAASFVNAMLSHDLAQETSQMLGGFVRIDRLGLLWRELYRCGTERVAVHIPYGISAFHDESIGFGVICARRGC